MARVPVDTIARKLEEGHSPYAIATILAKEGFQCSVYDIQTIKRGMETQRLTAAAVPPPPPFMQFVPEVSRQKKYASPLHLAPVVELIEKIGVEPIRAVVHAPPRHGKTECISHSIAYHLRKDPTLLFGFSTYERNLSYSKSRDCQAIAKRAGVKLARDAAHEWRTIEGGGLLATSTGGPLTGYGLNCMFIDDAYKNRLQAESRVIRNAIWDWFSDVVMTRIEPGGSVFIEMTRWHPDDLAGRALRERGKHRYSPEGTRLCQADCPGCGPNPRDGFIEIRLPAIDDHGCALWPERWPAEALERRRREVGEYTWFSLYQGTPRGRGTAVFSGVYFYDPAQMPSGGFSITIGIDLAYTDDTSADWAVAVVLMHFGDESRVLEVVRDQTTAPKFAKQLKELRRRWKGAPMYSIFYGAEKGSIDFMRTLGIPIKGLKRPGDKFSRSQKTAAAWNEGKILIPQAVTVTDDYSEKYPWLEPFVAVVTQFTGVKDDSDDDVDALVAAYEGRGKSMAAKLDTAKALAQRTPKEEQIGWREPERNGFDVESF